MSRQDIDSRSLSYYAWKRLRKNKLAVSGMFIIGLAIVVAILGALIRPDSSLHANDQKLQLGKKKPGFSVSILKVKKNGDIPTTYFWEQLLFGGAENPYQIIPFYSYEFQDDQIVLEEYTGNNEKLPGKKTSFHIADVVYNIDSDNKYDKLGTGSISFYTDGKEQTADIATLTEQIKAELITTKTFWLGTDQFGRDLLSRLMAGTLVSLSVGFISVFISLIIGIFLGAIGGFFRGWLDDGIMWIINVVWSIPTLLLVIAITFALGKGFWQIYVAVGLTMWVEVARIVRGQVISLREKEFIEAGTALGFSNNRIITKHVLPNVMGPVIVISAANFASAIIIEAGLSFLGIGIQPPMASWGRMIKEHYGFITGDGAYLAILPGLAIMLMVLAFMLVGNGLRDALDTTSIMSGSGKVKAK